MVAVSSPSASIGEAPATTLRLADGRDLTVRAVRLDDVAGLAALYRSLSDDDRYRRFFSTYRPDDAFFVRLATIAERGGYGLVAQLSDAGESHIVAEAGYELLPDGDGELAITVAPAQRGWLGPFLLDALLRAAADRGVPNLQADILVGNGPMQALVCNRGFAIVDRPDWSFVRVVIGAATRTPGWAKDDHRPRVLVEGGASSWRAEAAARAAGVGLRVCPGPLSPLAHCPALEGEPCPLAAGADVILLAGPPGSDCAALLEAHAHLHPGIPICIDLAGHGDEPPAGTVPLPAGVGVDGVVAFLLDAAQGHRAGVES